MNQNEVLIWFKNHSDNYFSVKEAHIFCCDSCCERAFRSKVRQLYTYGFLDIKFFPSVDGKSMFFPKYRLKNSFNN